MGVEGYGIKVSLKTKWGCWMKGDGWRKEDGNIIGKYNWRNGTAVDRQKLQKLERSFQKS